MKVASMIDENLEKPHGNGFEVPLGSIWVEPESKKCYQWDERWLVIKSNALASRQIKGLESRLVKVEERLLSLKKRPGKNEKILEQKDTRSPEGKEINPVYHILN
ncbi:MAG: hypothetical protein AB4041_14460 [Microcystaceae cyanobacterium]